MPKIGVYCADYSESYCTTLRDAVAVEEDMLWLGSATDGNRAHEDICRLKPDIVVQALVLPGMDGFALLEHICALPAAPAVIVTSLITRECCIEESIRLGASYYLVKPVASDLLIRRIRDICRLRARFYPENAPPAAEPPPHGEEIVGTLLRELGMSPSLKGYHYLVDAVLESLSLPRTSVSRELYPELARKFDATLAGVERAIRHAILTAWTRPSSEARSRLFGEERPSNRRLILRLAREVEPLLHRERSPGAAR